MATRDIQIDFDAPAVLRKWPSIRNQRRIDLQNSTPYLVQEGTLLECMIALLAKPASQHRLYEVHAGAQEPWVKNVLSAEHVYELARLRKLLNL